MISLDRLMDDSIGVIGYWVTPFQTSSQGKGREAITTMLKWIEEGLLNVVEGPAFPISRAGAAQAAIESRTSVGKVTLTVDEDSWAKGE